MRRTPLCRMLAVLAPALWVAGCLAPTEPDPGFHDKDRAGATTTVQGRALTMSSEPAAGADAYLVTDNRVARHTRTAADGSFVLADAPAGKAVLVLNDRNGLGAVQDLTLYPDGVNSAGDLMLSPLEKVPRIFSMRGVGFEERLTQSAGSYQWPVYSSDRSFVVAARKKDGDERHDLVSIDTSTGTETTLVAQVLLGSWAPADYYRLPDASDNRLRLAGDRVLVYDDGHYVESNKPPRWATVAFDMVARKSIYVSPADHHAIGAFVAGGALYQLESVETRAYNVGVMVYQSSYRVARVDLTTGAATFSDTLSVGLVDGFRVFLHDQRQLILVPFAGCYTSPGCQPPVQTGFHRIDLATFTDTPVALSGQGPQTALLSPDGASVFAVLSHSYGLPCGVGGYTAYETVTRVDIASGKETELYVSEEHCSDVAGYLDELALSPDGRLLAARSWTSDSKGQPTFRELVTFDSVSGAKRTLPLQYTAGGTTFTLCQLPTCGATVCMGYRPRCDLSFTAKGDFRITEEFSRSGARSAAVVDVPGAGPARPRLFSLGASDDAPSLFASPDGSLEAALLRDPASGFLQIYLGEVATDPQPTRQMTFVTANHSSAAFSADGQWLIYFTRDPVSGYVELYRVEAD